MLIFEN